MNLPKAQRKLSIYEDMGEGGREEEEEEEEGGREGEEVRMMSLTFHLVKVCA